MSTSAARTRLLVAADEWPAGTLLVTTVDTETGERQLWDRTHGVPHGALWSGTNADPAVGARAVVVVDPQAHLFPLEPLHRELAAVDAGSTVMIMPDPAAIDDFGPDLSDGKAWQPAYRAGARQAEKATERLRVAHHEHG